MRDGMSSLGWKGIGEPTPFSFLVLDSARGGGRERHLAWMKATLGLLSERSSLP